MVKSEYFPESLDDRLLCEPRPCDNLLLPEDIQIISNNEDISMNNRQDNTINVCIIIIFNITLKFN